MTAAPLVAVVSNAPLLSEGIAAAVDDLAEVRILPADSGTPSLLRLIRPDAIVVDDAGQAEAAEPVARQAGVPLLHISLSDRQLRVFGEDGWSENAGDGGSPEAIRIVLAAALFGRSRA